MNDSFSDDTLLSAYFDGETTPAESEAAEKQLSQSEGAHRRLAAYGLLSELLQDLPRQEAPPELASQVLHLAERQSLLAAPDGPNSSDHSHSRKSISPLDFWAPLVVVAAVVLVLVVPFGPDFSESDRHFVAMTEMPDRISGEMNDARSFSSVDADRIEDNVRESTISHAELSGSRVVPLPVELAEVDNNEEALAMQLKSLSLQAEAAVEQKKFVFRESLKDLPVGAVVSAISTSSNPEEKVAVVKLWVVDRQQGVDKLQVLLSRQPMSGEAGAGTPVRKTPAEEAASSNESEEMQASDLVAVYVEATNEQLVSALDRMREEETFVGLSVQEPVSVPPVELAQSIGKKVGDEVEEGEPRDETIVSIHAFGKTYAGRQQNGVRHIQVQGNLANSLQIVVAQRAGQNQRFSIRIQPDFTENAPSPVATTLPAAPPQPARAPFKPGLQPKLEGKPASEAKKELLEKRVPTGSKQRDEKQKRQEKSVPVLFLVQKQSVPPHH